MPNLTFNIENRLMMEEANVSKRHGDAVLVAHADDVIVADGAAGLSDIAHAAAVRALDVVAEGEERVAAQRHAGEAPEPLGLLLFSQWLGTHGEEAAPHVVAQHVGGLGGGEIQIDCVVALRAAEALDE